MQNDDNQYQEPRWVSLSLNERFKNVLYPVDLPVLLRLLPNIGYVVTKKILKGVLEPGEPWAVKGNVELLVNQDNKTLGVEGREISQVVDGFSELRAFWLDELSPCPDAETHYVELAGNGILRSLKNPTEVFTRFWSQSERLQRLSKTVGLDAVNFGLRLVPQNAAPNNADWFDLLIQPDVISSGNHYRINIAWRNKDVQTALESFRKVNETIRAVIREIERK
ncbi:hypothetical protein M1N79_04690 [Dehalococcoidia bacterium]|nr:hypothetical protein [Dehalococcoidia bacterium]